MVAFPQSNLPPKSQPWGRNIEKSLTSTASSARSTSLATNNNLKQINSSINLLQKQQDILQQNQVTLIEQQDFLSGLQTYVSQSAVQETSYAIKTWNYFTPLSLTFTIDRPYSVIVSASGETDSFSSGILTTPTAGIEWKCTITNNGSTYESFVGTQLSIAPHTSSYRVYDTVNEPSTNSRVLSLAAGTHTFTATWGGYNYGDTGQGGSLSLLERTLSATVVG